MKRLEEVSEENKENIDEINKSKEIVVGILKSIDAQPPKSKKLSTICQSLNNEIKSKIK